MATTNDQVTTPTAGGFSFHGSPGWLSRRRGLVVGAAVAAAAIALALSQHLLAIANRGPLLVVLPCAVMMFTCMKGMNRGQQADTEQTSLQNAAPLPASEAKTIESVR